MVSNPGSVRSIRILFAEEVTTLSRAVIREMFRGQDDVTFVDEDEDTPAGEGEVDVVIRASAGAGDPFRWPPPAFADSPRNVLAITIAGSQVTLCEIHPHYPAMRDPSPEAVVAAIRGAVARWR